MNIHSVPLNTLARRTRATHADATPGSKRDAILRAAIDLFAERGYFNSQVADVARAAGVAAGTVYLYFKSKDDLLVSIFDRSMRDGLEAGRASVAGLDDPEERLRRLARGHLANAGLPVLLLDLTADVAREGLKRARALKPDPFFTPDVPSSITIGGFDGDFQKIAAADWIMEAVVERIDVKRPLLERVDAARRPGSIVSTNTSGISVTALAEGRSDDFRRHWLGTHFFNPPRYLHLLELIPTADTDPAVVSEVAAFGDHRLGKGVVVAKDTPNFIANHIGVYGVVQVLRALEAGAYTIEEIDAITGPALGRPKSATFPTMDIAGLDILAHVAANLRVELPPLIAALVERGWTG